MLVAASKYWLRDKPLPDDPVIKLDRRSIGRKNRPASPKLLLRTLVASGPSRHFAATQQTVAFGCKATVREELLIVPNLCARAGYSDTGSISVGSSSGAREVEFCVHRIDN